MIKKLHDSLQKKEFSAEELTGFYLRQIARHNPALNAYITVTEEEALQAAKEADRRLQAGDGGPLTGIPFALKDNLSTRGILTGCASRILEGYRPLYTATAAQKLEDAGGVLLGKCNLDEFGMGSTNETSAYGPVKNPIDPSRVPGGSSGGPAAAVKAGLCAYALGSDTGGSIRQPASFCGVVGLKPTYGAVSRRGLIAYASSFDTVGPLAPCAEDAAFVLEAIWGHDPLDTTSARREYEPLLPQLERDVKGLRIGVAGEFFMGLSPEVNEVLQAALLTYEKMGAEIVPLTLDIARAALPVYYILACAEASSNLGRYDGLRYGRRAQSYESPEDLVIRSRTEGFGPEVKRRIMLGTYVLSAGYYDAYYKRAQLLRQEIKARFAKAFTLCDLLFAPTVGSVAFPLGSQQDPVEMYQTDVCTVPVNVAGLPALSLPAGYAEGLPVGMQLIAPAFNEGLLLCAARRYEDAEPGLYRPPLVGGEAFS